mmetsp:Transcript_2809/g.7785  ORF Transcript_2809/g.7785 Transcript_2809/m.7785 type:complete len:215 (-) Transcript_2809:1653-2297(-)
MFFVHFPHRILHLAHFVVGASVYLLENLLCLQVKIVGFRRLVHVHADSPKFKYHLCNLRMLPAKRLNQYVTDVDKDLVRMGKFLLLPVDIRHIGANVAVFWMGDAKLRLKDVQRIPVHAQRLLVVSNFLFHQTNVVVNASDFTVVPPKRALHYRKSIIVLIQCGLEVSSFPIHVSQVNFHHPHLVVTKAESIAQHCTGSHKRVLRLIIVATFLK